MEPKVSKKYFSLESKNPCLISLANICVICKNIQSWNWLLKTQNILQRRYTKNDTKNTRTENVHGKRSGNAVEIIVICV